MMLIFMKMILKLSFMSDLWLGVINSKNGKLLRKKLMERIKEINACSMASCKMWDWCMQEDEKKGTEPFFIDEN